MPQSEGAAVKVGRSTAGKFVSLNQRNTSSPVPIKPFSNNEWGGSHDTALQKACQKIAAAKLNFKVRWKDQVEDKVTICTTLQLLAMHLCLSPITK